MFGLNQSVREVFEISGFSAILAVYPSEAEALAAIEGVIDVLNAAYGVGRELAGSQQWPQWYPNNPFKAARDTMMAKPAPAPAQ